MENELLMNWRRIKNYLVYCLTGLATLLTLIPLALILYYLLASGFKFISWDFFTQMPKPVGEMGGGMANAIAGSLLLMGLALALGGPIGIFGGIYLSEFASKRTKTVLQFCVDLLSGTPSIVIGVFVYTILVLPLKHFSALAGGVALGIMMIPTVIRSTEESLKLVPKDLREGGLALGIPYWKVVLLIVISTARSGIVTGICLAIARVAGETAPLLFTALGNQFWSLSLNQPIAAIPMQIFIYATSPFEEWQAQAWAGALVLIMLIVIFNLGARFIFANRLKTH